VSLARLVRSAGLLSMVAAALIVVSEIVAFLSGGIGLINGVVRVVAFFLLLLGLVGLYARQSEEAGKLGLAGFHLAFLGTMLLAGDLWFEAFAVPYLEDVAARVVETTPTGTLIAGGAASFAFFGLGWMGFWMWRSDRSSPIGQPVL
jgi:hypothetical protein